MKNLNNILTLLLIIVSSTCKPLLSTANEGDLSFKDQKYFLKNSYTSRNYYVHFDDRHLKDECQDEVYAAAFNLAQQNSLKIIGDIGCGSGFKLIKYFSNFETIGFDLEPALSFVKNKYPDRQWHLSDFKNDKILPKFDILICSDVIEHLLNPDDLLNWIKKLDFKYLVISTPNRDILTTIYPYNQNVDGPPFNQCHLREWSFYEFNKYISQYFNVEAHFPTAKEYWGQVIIATKK